MLKITAPGGKTLFDVDQVSGLITFNGVPLSFPNSQGGPLQVLSNDGAGVFSWVTPQLFAGVTCDASGNLTATSFIGSGASLTSVPGPVATKAYGAGTNYVLTTSAAKVALGTTSPSVSLAAGTYRIHASVQAKLNNAVVPASSGLSFKIRNVTGSADIANSTLVIDLPELAVGLTQSYAVIPLPIVEVTLGVTTTVEVWGQITQAITSGTVEISASGSWIVAEKIA